MKAFTYVLVGMLLGSGFVYDKLSTPPHVEEGKTEIVMGHRVDSNGNFMLVTAK